MSCKMHTDTSDQVWVFLGGGVGWGGRERSMVLPPNPIPILHLFTANRTSGVLQLQPHVLSRHPAPSPEPPALLSPSPPRLFPTSPLKTLKHVSANSLPLPQVTQKWKEKDIQKTTYQSPSSPCLPSTSSSWVLPQDTDPSPHVSPCTASPASAHAPT